MAQKTGLEPLARSLVRANYSAHPLSFHRVLLKGFAMKFPKPWFRKVRGWFVTLDGKQIKLGTKREAAFAEYQQLISQPAARRPATTRTISLVEIVEHFLEWTQKHRAPDTYEWYRYRLERLCRRHSDIAAEQLKPFMVQQWVDGYELSVTSQRNYLRSAKRCYKWARRLGYIENNPIADMEVPKAEEKDVFFSPEEFAHIMSFVRNPRLADLMNVTWQTGCRPQESRIVEARHVDVKHQRWVFHRTESKMKRVARVVYLTDDALAITKRLMLANPSGPIFRNRAGRPWSKDSVNCGVDAVRVRMGKAEMKRQGVAISDEEVMTLIPSLKPEKVVKGLVRAKTKAELRHEARDKLTQKKAAQFAQRCSLYSLRHSFATNALQKGIDSLTVAILLGHEDPSTLARVYQHLNQNPKHLLQEMRKSAG